MYFCPNCNVSLKRVMEVKGIHWVCTTCEGRSSMISLLRKTAPTAIVNNLWISAKSNNYPRRRECSACNNLMTEIPIAVPDGIQKIDVCVTCQFVWFDKEEYQSIPNHSDLVQQKPPLSDAAREKIAEWELERQKQKENDEFLKSGSPKENWHWIPGYLGLPVELDAKPVEVKPIVTWGVTGLVTIASVIALFNLTNTIANYGLVPANWSRYGGFTLITSFLIHGSILHLISNMYFLFIFGDNVEEWLGTKRFLFLLFISAFVGNVAHIASSPHSMVPCIGASGGVSGVLTFYALKFPHVKIGINLFTYLGRFAVLNGKRGGWFYFPAILLFLIWVLIQFLGVYLQLFGYSNVSYAAHLGGAFVGLVFWFCTKDE